MSSYMIAAPIDLFHVEITTKLIVVVFIVDLKKSCFIKLEDM